MADREYNYQDEAEMLRQGLGARSLGLFVIEGPCGSGFSLVTENDPARMLELAEMLEQTAAGIRKDVERRQAADPDPDSETLN